MYSESKKGSFIHLGGDVSVYAEDIIGVFDMERTTVSGQVKDYLAAAQKGGQIYYCSLDMPKSFVITDETVFVTNVAAGTIKKRTNPQN